MALPSLASRIGVHMPNRRESGLKHALAPSAERPRGGFHSRRVAPGASTPSSPTAMLTLLCTYARAIPIHRFTCADIWSIWLETPSAAFIVAQRTEWARNSIVTRDSQSIACPNVAFVPMPRLVLRWRKRQEI
ncbi:hypothetical protein C8Q78DRAFT_401906 [Trametes maxima]|nr:hypothetical protein C8Q78DRAFT_401906 [Trametes maxima]